MTSNVIDPHCGEEYQRRVAYCDTDAMAVVHHSNYLRYFEEARVDWLRRHQLSQYHAPHFDLTLAVLSTQVEHLKPAYFDDLLQITMVARLERLKIRFRYAISSSRFGTETICRGETLHVPLNRDFRVVRLPEPVINTLEAAQWIEI